MRYETCSQCDKEKHETEFYSNGSGKFRSRCKDCTKASRRSEAYKAAQLAYDRSEKGRECKRRYNVSELGKARNQDYYYLHRDERLDGARFAKIKRRFSAEEWQAIQERQQANYLRRLASPPDFSTIFDSLRALDTGEDLKAGEIRLKNCRHR